MERMKGDWEGKREGESRSEAEGVGDDGIEMEARYGIYSRE